MALSADRLNLSVPGKTLCRDLTLTVQPGECWGILGRNGSGKTTLLHALAGLSSPDSGAVSWAGRPLADYPRRELARRIGVLPQDEGHEFFGTVREYALLGRYPHSSGFALGAEDEEAALAALHQVGMAGLAGRALNTLSGGERQRVRIAMLLAQAPQLYCLDEPLQHLDLGHQAEALNLLRELAAKQGKAVLMVLHETLWAGRYCDRILLLYDGGKILAGPSAELMTLKNLEELYQCPLQKIDTATGGFFLPA
ncbi:MAG: ABC transporter ATP-binding protein [Sulfuricella sp.]|nr:ABC transporter ATP-binding protein [Sulfuricella sp.]